MEFTGFANRGTSARITGSRSAAGFRILTGSSLLNPSLWLGVFCLSAITVPWAAGAENAELLAPDVPVAAAIDHYVDQTLSRQHVSPSPLASDATLLRRTMLDLAGRIPTPDELQQYLTSPDPEKRVRLVDQLMQSPAYVRHGAREFDRLLSAENESAPSLETYLLTAIRERRHWDRMLAELFGISAEPVDEAARFVTGRLADRDALTRDVSNVVFGINVSCCQCHQHPSVDYLSQEHYFGLKAFFHRSFEFQGRLMERAFAEPVRFKPRDGEEQVTRLLLLTGTVVALPPANAENLKTAIEEEDRTIATRREKFGEQKAYPDLPQFIGRRALIEGALQPSERHLVARSIINRLWYRFFGYGLVMRVDQMHPGNPPSHPELLEWLTRDLIEHQYDLHRLIREFVLSATYARSSEWTGDSVPAPELFAVAAVRALTPMQYALSLRVASQPDLLPGTMSPEQFDQSLVRLEDEARKSLAPLFVEPIEGLQIGVNEALRLSNDPELLKILGDGLVNALLQDPSPDHQIDRLFVTVASRPGEPDEREALRNYLHDSGISQPAAAVQKHRRLTAQRQTVPELRQRLTQREDHAKQTAMMSQLKQTAAYLDIAAAEYRGTVSDETQHRLEASGLSAAVYQNWRRCLRLHVPGTAPDGAENLLKQHFAERMVAVSGNSSVIGLGSPETPSVVVNLSDQPIQLFSFAYPPQRITVHPSRTQDVIAAWRSPMAGTVNFHCRLRDLDSAGGNGFGMKIQLVQAGAAQQLLTASVSNGGSVEFRTDKPIHVSSGDTLAVSVDALDRNHGFDSTEVDLVLTEVGGEARVWNITQDVTPTLFDNPHSDRYGNPAVWHFAMSGYPAAKVPGGSLLDEWNLQLRRQSSDERVLQELAGRVQALLTDELPEGTAEPDSALRRQFTAADGPIFNSVEISDTFDETTRSELAGLRAEIATAEQIPPETLTEAEQAELDRVRQTLHQMAWALLTSAEFRFNH